MTQRLELGPYKRQRLGFEGVLIEVIRPNSRNGFTYGLVFVSLYSQNKRVEIDHAVISVSVPLFHKAELEMHKRYYFTAEVGTYHKTALIIGTLAQRECYMLKDINMYKIAELPHSNLVQPTMYVMQRITNTLMSKVIAPRHTEEELLAMIKDMPNDGTVEKFINTYTQSYQTKHVTNNELIETLYS